MAQTLDPSTSNRLCKARETMAANREARDKLRLDLPGGWLIKKDSPPGVGWVLKPPKGNGGPLRFYAEREQAISRWKTLATVDDPELEQAIHSWCEPLAA